MIPKFSIRQMFLAMIAVGLISACLAGASRGNRFAYGLSVAILGLIIPFLVYAVIYWAGYWMALVGKRPSRSNSTKVIGSGEIALEDERAGKVDD